MSAPMPSCLLTYLFFANPDPIQVSSPQSEVDGRVNIAVFQADPTHPTVYCQQIRVAIPVGTDAGSLFASTLEGSSNTNKWVLTSSGQKKGNELDFEEDNETYAYFYYDCTSPSDYLINYNLVFGASGTVNQKQGPFTIKIRELSGTTNDPKTFTHKLSPFTLNKALPQFYLQNFVAVAPSAQTVPRTDFSNGGDIMFKWESNGTYFQIFRKDVTKPIYADADKLFTLKGGVRRDTTFVLVASVTGAPDQDGQGGGYEPIYLYDSLTITISDPVIEDTLTVEGKVSALSELSVEGKVSALSELSVKGKVSALSELSVKGVDFGELVAKVDKQAIEIAQLLAIPRPLVGSGSADSTNTPGWTLSSGTAVRLYFADVKFPWKFAHPPTVMVALTSIDAEHTSNTRVLITAVNVNSEGFQVRMQTWADSIIWGLSYSWIAI
jgi:hypothetical protein